MMKVASLLLPLAAATGEFQLECTASKGCKCPLFKILKMMDKLKKTIIAEGECGWIEG